MSYTKRVDGRKWDEMRPMSAKVGVVKRAVGSAMFQIGNTIAVAAVYGPKFASAHIKMSDKGILRCEYNMMAFSGSGERVRPGPSRRSKEISMITEKALGAVVDLSAFPNTIVEVHIELLQTDAGTRCAGICAASMALADAGLPMKDLVAAISAGKVEDKILLDLVYEEDSHEEGVDIPVAMTGRNNEIVLLQMDGKISKQDFFKCIEFAKKGCQKIIEVQKEALKEKYKGVGEDE